MNHNDVLRRLRYALQLDDSATIAIFGLVDYSMEKDYLTMLMKKEDQPDFMLCRDKIMSLFLDGLIIKRRGKQEGVEPVVLKGGEILSNNDILRKIRIAMSYRDEDMLAVLKLANFRLSKGELSALFRKPDHRNYKECGDQVVRNLLKGMVIKYRPDSTANSESATKKYTPKPKIKRESTTDSKPEISQQPKSKATESEPQHKVKTVEAAPKPKSKPVKATEPRPSVWGEVKPK